MAVVVAMAAVAASRAIAVQALSELLVWCALAAWRQALLLVNETLAPAALKEGCTCKADKRAQRTESMSCLAALQLGASPHDMDPSFA